MPFSSQRWLDLPYLEDVALLLEALHNPLRSSSTHRIRRILEEYNQIKPELNMESWTIIWFDHYQTKIWRPGDILHLPEYQEEKNMEQFTFLDSSSIFL